MMARVREWLADACHMALYLLWLPYAVLYVWYWVVSARIKGELIDDDEEE